MLNYNDVIVDSTAYNMVRLDADENRISHAYLFISDDADYLRAFLLETARMLICLDDIEKNKNIMDRIQKNIHPDVHIYGFDENKVNVDSISEICSLSQVSPFEADKKIFIINNFGKINEIAQNKILKTIEEPPENTYFIIGASDISGIIPTIISRVKQITLNLVSYDKIESMLIDSGIDGVSAKICANCSGQSATFAEKIARDKDFFTFFEKVISCFYEINGSNDVFEYSSYFSAKNIDKNIFFDITILIARDIMMIMSGKENLVICKNIIDKLRKIAVTLNINAITELISLSIKSKEDLTFNANQTAVTDKFLFKLAEVKVKCRRLLA